MPVNQCIEDTLLNVQCSAKRSAYSCDVNLIKWSWCWISRLIARV